jgi:N-acetylglucosamine-6-phosphate deacetylase
LAIGRRLSQAEDACQYRIYDIGDLPYAHIRTTADADGVAAPPMIVESPGFCDLQVNGFAGLDFNRSGLSQEQLDGCAAALRRTGVTRFLPTLVTQSLEAFSACARVLARWRSPAMLGIHMEGPYLSPTEARGAHPQAHLRPASKDDFERRQHAAEGRIVLVTLAPEVPGALELIGDLVGAGVRVAIGHSDAAPARIRDAIRAGATLSTHLGNGCAPGLPRHPNLIWEQLAADELAACFIVDGHHLPASTVKAMVRAKTPARTILVTDATAAAAAPPGRYTLGELHVERNAAGRVTLPGEGKLAGSAQTLDQAVARAARETGLPIAEVLPMASAHPARAIGVAPAGRVRAEWDAAAGTLAVTGVEGE